MTADGATGIVPVHNEASVLEEVLRSIEAQTHPLDELVLVFDVGDGSRRTLSPPQRTGTLSPAVWVSGGSALLYSQSDATEGSTSGSLVKQDVRTGAARVPDSVQHLQRWAAQSAEVRRSHDCALDIAYGDQPGERLDVFPAGHPGAPVLVFIHGGYWRALDKSDHSFVAPAFTRDGACVVIPNYALCPAVTVPQITLQVARAVAWTATGIVLLPGALAGPGPRVRSLRALAYGIGILAGMTGRGFEEYRG